MCIRDSHGDALRGLVLTGAGGDPGALAKVGAVSYTHLDVYKRQVGHLAGVGVDPVEGLVTVGDEVFVALATACLLYTSRCV